MFLPFQVEILEKLKTTNNALIILGSGMGSDLIINALLKACNQTSLVIVLSPSKTLPFSLAELSGEITSECSSRERSKIYLKGGSVYVSSRMFIVDLLNERLPVHLITGIIVLDAHLVTSTSNEAFILYVFRQFNSQGFIYGFSESPHLFRLNNTLEKSLISMQMQSCFLYPRFEVTASKDLEANSIEVVEYHCSIDSNVEKIQLSILDIINCCLSDARRCGKIVIDCLLEDILADGVSVIYSEIGSDFSPKVGELINDIRLCNYIFIFIYRQANVVDVISIGFSGIFKICREYGFPCKD